MLTRVDGNGNWCINGVRWDELREGCTLSKEAADAIYMAACKLKDYEDTGLTPEGVDRLSEDNDALKERVWGLEDEVKWLRDKLVPSITSI